MEAPILLGKEDEGLQAWFKDSDSGETTLNMPRPDCYYSALFRDGHLPPSRKL